MTTRFWRWTPMTISLIAIAGLFWVLWTSLFLNPRELPSPLIDTPLPAALVSLAFQKQPGIIHVFSNPDDQEVIKKITQKWPIPFYGIRYKGDPFFTEGYQWVVPDQGKIGIELGVRSTPEFFIIDAANQIRYKHSGPLSEKEFEKTLMPILSNLSSTSFKPLSQSKPTSVLPILKVNPLESYEKLIKELRCVTCQNQSLAESSAPIAISMREAIYAKLHEGQNEAQIKQFLVDRYGDYILYNPPVKKETWILWWAPFLFLLIGCGLGLKLFYPLNK